MWPVATTARGPGRLLLLQRVRRRAAPTPHPSPSPSPPPSPSPSPPSPTSSAATPDASASPPPATNKRKAEESPLPESDSDGGGKRMKIGDTSSSSSAAGEAVWGTVTLEEIRAMPQSATRPFYPRTLRRGTRSLKEPKPWKCSACGHFNALSPHLMFDLPAFHCKRCGGDPNKGDTDFGFCYADLGMNEACPIGHVKLQKPGECIPNTLVSCVEITHRIMATVLGQPFDKHGPNIDISDLISKYNKKWVKEGNKISRIYNGLSLLTMIQVFQQDGVKEKETSELQERPSSALLHKVADWVWVDQTDFLALSSAIADGYPLICLFKTGPRLRYLKAGDIYVPPPENMAMGGHAGLLIGAEQQGDVKFLYFLSSSGEMFCQRSDKPGDGIRGGVGAITTGHFDFDAIQILRFNERKKQVVQVEQP